MRVPRSHLDTTLVSSVSRDVLESNLTDDDKAATRSSLGEKAEGQSWRVFGQQPRAQLHVVLNGQLENVAPAENFLFLAAEDEDVVGGAWQRLRIGELVSIELSQWVKRSTGTLATEDAEGGGGCEYNHIF